MGEKFKVYSLLEIMQRELKNGSHNLVTRQTGELIRQGIEGDFNNEPEGQAVILDFGKVGIIDYSCADEIVAKLIGRLINDEYGDKFILLQNLDSTQRENIQVALERKRQAALEITPEKRLRVLGTLNPYLIEVFDRVIQNKAVTARALADSTGEEINSASTKLANLYKVRLLARETQMLPDGGRQFIYKPIGPIVDESSLQKN